MQVVRCIAVCVALLVASPVLAAAEACPVTPLDDFIRRGQDVYLGEGHGTVESPALVRCLVIVAMERRKERLIVSLEQVPTARDPEGEAWRGTDGRGSEAMWNLTRFLLEQEKAGRLELHLQLSFPIAFVPGTTPPQFDAAAYERNIGTPLREFAARGQLIALSGNMHSRQDRIPLPQFSYDPAGSYVGPDVVHVDLEPGAGGTAWNCDAGGCGIHELAGASPFVGPPHTMMDGKAFGHDFIYRLPGVTASPPRFPAANPPPGR
jgi:hypothetical protein